MLADVLHDGGLQSRERKVVPVVAHRTRESDGLGIAGTCEAVDRGTTGISESEKARNLVERLARRVVDRLPEHAVLPVVAHRDDQGVTARHDESHEWRFECGVLDHRGVEMRLVVMHRYI